MAQAFRSKKGSGSSDSAEFGLRIVGCYSLDHKVVVEWEKFLDERELLELLAELPSGLLAFEAIRLVTSSWCQSHDASLTTVRFTHYRANRESVSAVITWAEERGLLLQKRPTGSSGVTAWTHQPIPTTHTPGE